MLRHEFQVFPQPTPTGAMMGCKHCGAKDNENIPWCRLVNQTSATCEETKSTDDVCIKLRRISASAMGNTEHNPYDMFTPPCSHEAYIPNTRLQRLMKLFCSMTSSNQDMRDVELKLRVSSSLMQSWQHPIGGTETAVNCRLLESYLMIIYGIMSRSRNDVVFNTDTSFLLDSQLCSSSTQQEVCITHVNSIIIASEAKGVDKSEFVSLMQCLQVCADGALQLFQKGLREGDCVVPGVICFGESLRIVAVYFTPTTFPVLAYLSDLLSISTWEGRSKLSCWAIALSQFGLETIDLSLNMKGMQSRSPDKVKFRLCRQQFFKPVRNIETNDGAGIGIAESDVSSARVNLDVLMSVYSHLHSVVDADKSILFPVGVVSCPSTQNENGDDIRALLINFMKQHFRKWSNENNFNHLIFVIYPHLNSSDGWQSSDIRPPQELVEAYLMSLAQAVNVLNQAEIAHIDLRPANILWRILPEEMGVDRLVSQSSSTIPLKGNIGSDRIGASVEIQIIDFEDAVPFGWLIKHAANYRRHPSYPDFGPTSVVTIGAESSSSSQVTRDVAVLVAGQPHNDFFLRAITKWLRGT